MVRLWLLTLRILGVRITDKNLRFPVKDLTGPLSLGCYGLQCKSDTTGLNWISFA
jgi:hypothetical protein